MDSNLRIISLWLFARKFVVVKKKLLIFNSNECEVKIRLSFFIVLNHAETTSVESWPTYRTRQEEIKFAQLLNTPGVSINKF